MENTDIVIHCSVKLVSGKTVILRTENEILNFVNNILSLPAEEQRPAEIFYISTNRQPEVYQHLPHCEEVCGFDYFIDNFLGKLNPMCIHSDFLGVSGLLTDRTEEMLESL